MNILNFQKSMQKLERQKRSKQIEEDSGCHMCVRPKSKVWTD